MKTAWKEIGYSQLESGVIDRVLEQDHTVSFRVGHIDQIVETACIPEVSQRRHPWDREWGLSDLEDGQLSGRG